MALPTHPSSLTKAFPSPQVVPRPHRHRHQHPTLAPNSASAHRMQTFPDPHSHYFQDSHAYSPYRSPHQHRHAHAQGHGPYPPQGQAQRTAPHRDPCANAEVSANESVNAPNSASVPESASACAWCESANGLASAHPAAWQYACGGARRVSPYCPWAAEMESRKTSSPWHGCLVH